ncbi:G2/mitotic-specific cyclin-2-like isoform X2 [Momordica charantia]|uniref:B-like cyclin n=1 Tax=Momordica charantia TaxID=3673 RepID=A0A6J1BW56_MOMCH|nr:G2/mitotic-specific cyclin-2-like isoform X2 [Momordica charantia]
MAFSDENNPNLIKPTSGFLPGGGLEKKSSGRAFGQEIRGINNNRRALNDINHNSMVNQAYPVVNKRVLAGKQEICEKKQVDPFHRPITRKFAAQIASSQQLHHPQENSKGNSLLTNSNAFGQSIFVDEECKTAENDSPVPMFLEKTESPLPQEPSQMEEVEMEDIAEDDCDNPVIDIDGVDSKNPLAVVDYVDDLYAHYRKIENSSCVSPNYMAQQFDINERMRAILIDWLIEVHDKFDLMGETLFLTVNLIDRFLSRKTVVRKKLQLVGLVSMLLACKYEEVSVPIVGDLILISDKAYSRKEVLEMETVMLNCLQFNMSVPTPFVFLQRFLKAAQSDKKLELMAFFLIELSLVEYEMLRFPPSLLAAAATYTAQCTLTGVEGWSVTCEWHSSYSEDQLLECSRLMVGLHQKAATGKLTGVHRKYCTSKFNYTAKCEPAHFLLQTQQ